MVDATGRNVPAFGDGGVVLIDSLAAARTFLPEAAALGPNGDMIFVGSLSDTRPEGFCVSTRTASRSSRSGTAGTDSSSLRSPRHG